MRDGPGARSIRAACLFIFLSLHGKLSATDRAAALPAFAAGSPAAAAALESGRAALRRGDESGAEALWAAQLRQGEDGSLLDALGGLYFRRSHLAWAESCYERLVRLAPKSAEAWYRLGLVRAARGDYRAAADAQRLATGHASDFGAAYCALALDLRQSGQRDMSAWAAQRALDLMPGYAGAWNLLGALQQDAGSLQEAHRSYSHALSLDPDYASAWFNLAQLCEREGQRGGALRAYGEAIRARPGFAEARLARAELEMDRAALSAARRDFGACRDFDGWAPEAWWGLRRVDEAEGHKAAAAKDLRRYYLGVHLRDRAQARKAERGLEDPSPYVTEPSAALDAEANPLEAHP
jgi:tetratricopeptide (TPR) repeat protein